MYSKCLFCHSDLGANEVIERFPVGGRLAFDEAKGRLWVVCGRVADFIAQLSGLGFPTRSARSDDCHYSYAGFRHRVYNSIAADDNLPVGPILREERATKGKLGEMRGPNDKALAKILRARFGILGDEAIGALKIAPGTGGPLDFQSRRSATLLRMCGRAACGVPSQPVHGCTHARL